MGASRSTATDAPTPPARRDDSEKIKFVVRRQMLQIQRRGVPRGRTIQSRRNADFPTFPTGPSRSPDLDGV